jgi:hypothetical protein
MLALHGVLSVHIVLAFVKVETFWYFKRLGVQASMIKATKSTRHQSKQWQQSKPKRRENNASASNVHVHAILPF